MIMSFAIRQLEERSSKALQLQGDEQVQDESELSHERKSNNFDQQLPASSLRKLRSATSHDSGLNSYDNDLDTAINSNVDNKHPFRIGHLIGARYRDDTVRLAKIVSRKQDKSSRIDTSNNGWSYYVHYKDFNRRMDEWISSDRIVIFPSEANKMDFGVEHTDPRPSRLYARARAKSSKYIAHFDNVSKSSSTSNSCSNSNSSGDDEDDADHFNQDAAFGAVISDSRAAFSTIADLEHDEHEGLDKESVLEHEEITKIKNVSNVQLGKFTMECWYFSPLPKEFYMDGSVHCLYFCEFTFRFFKTNDELRRYHQKIPLPRHPPGNEIYRDDKVSVFELDGSNEKTFCQNLCYFAKLFLDHKTLYWDVDPFLFYVVCRYDDKGYHPVGFFSKEKYSDAGYNLACILTFPSAQRQGYGRFLISLSYALSQKEKKLGSPEKPLSDLGAVSYKSYWACVVLLSLKQFAGQSVSLIDLSVMTSIMPEDIYATLQLLGLLLEVDDEVSIYAPQQLIDLLLEKYPLGEKTVDPDKLHWTPLYVIDPKKDKYSFLSLRSVNGNLPADDDEVHSSESRALLADNNYFNYPDNESNDE